MEKTEKENLTTNEKELEKIFEDIFLKTTYTKKGEKTQLTKLGKTMMYLFWVELMRKGLKWKNNEKQPNN